MLRFVCVLVLGLCAALQLGCVSGTTADGRGMVGLPLGDAGPIVDAAGAAGGTIGGALFGPLGSALGDSGGRALAIGIVGIAGWLQGRHRGWDENEEDRRKRRAAEGTGDPDGSGAAAALRPRGSLA